MEEVVKFLKACGAYFLATADGDQPRVRPFGTVNIFEGKLYIQTGKSKDCSKQIQKNGKVEICAMNKAGNPPRTEGRHAGALPRAQVDVLPRRRQHRDALLQGCGCHVLQLYGGSPHREVLGACFTRKTFHASSGFDPESFGRRGWQKNSPRRPHRRGIL